MRKLAFLAALLLSTATHAQSVQQSGTVTANHVTRWVGNGIVGDGGTASDSPITTLGVTSNTTAGFCISSGRSTAAGRQQLCLGAPLDSNAVISLQNYGTATAQGLSFVINGTTITIPTGGTGTIPTIALPTVTNNTICASNTTGALTNCTNGTNGQVWLGQTGTLPAWTTLSGDVSSVSAGGAVTLHSVNGVAFNNTYTAHGVLIAQGNSAFTTVTSASVGYCLLSQGIGTDPIYAPCASGAGTAGGSNTQVQYNNASSLAGSSSLTWVSPALTIGANASTTGQLVLANGGILGQSVTLQNLSTTSAYNFNLPSSAGTSGQPLLSGGGGSTAMSFGTLGVGGGGTNCVVASGTCIDNISSWSSTGFINRTGAGAYAFSAVIGVANGGTGLSTGTSGGILGFTGTGTVASSALLTQYGVVYGGGAGATPAATAAGTNGQVFLGQTGVAPAWATLGGDATISAAGTLTISNSAITNAKLANSAAYTLKGNFTGSSAAPQDSTLGALTQKVSPAAGDYILVADNAASGALKYATVSSIAAAGSVASIDTKTGAFTTANGIETTGANVIQVPAALRTFVTANAYTTGTNATYTTPANALWLEVYMWGAGGGGGGGGSGGGSGTAGGDTCWNTSGTACTTPLYSAGGGAAAGASGAIGGAGGTPGGSSSCIASGTGGKGTGFGGAGASAPGGAGGAAFGIGLPGAGAAPGGNAAVAAAANSGGGGGGGTTTASLIGNGGGGGAWCRAIITSPAASYVYTIGAGGSGGAAGTLGGAGAAGGSGYIYVIAHYNY